MTAEIFFREIRTPLRGLQLVVATLLLSAAVYSGLVVLAVGIYPFDLAITTVWGTGLIVLLVLPLLVARAIVPAKIVDTGLREIAAGEWELGARLGSRADDLIRRTGDVGRLWRLYTTQALVSTLLVAGAAITSLTAYVLDPSAPPLALGTVLVVAISSHFPTRSLVARWMAIHLHAIDDLRGPLRN